ncbi:MAG: OmpA family protein [Enhygromyxa sp.]
MRSLRIPLVAVLLLAGSVACDGDKDARISDLEAELASAQKAASDREAEAAQAAKQTAELEQAKTTIEELEAKLEEQQEKLTELESKKGALEGQLEQKQAALEAVKTLQDALSKSLVEEIETGDIRVSQRGGLLVVDVSDKVLFATGEAELSERGQKVLAQLAESLKALPDKAVFQVGGHTDNQPIKSEEVKAKFPTNWELSAARATNVVRFLEESAGIPGKRLVAAGFSQFRPVGSNKNAKGRAKNRRIEIALLPPAGK